MKWLGILGAVWKGIRWLFGNTDVFRCCTHCYQREICQRMRLCADDLHEKRDKTPVERPVK